jgi:DNA invertase Pin-like site-specific DNA recombinase
VSYHRVSTLDQDPTLARDELRRAAELRGFEIVESIEESGSGARNDRPGWQHALELARKGHVDALLVWKLDRAGRSALDLLANLRALEDAGVRFIATTQGIDLKPGGDPMSRLLVTLLSGVAEFERELIRERTLLGLEKAKRKGVKLGRRREVTPRQVTEALQLRAEGVSWRETAKKVRASVSSLRRACATNGVTVEAS